MIVTIIQFLIGVSIGSLMAEDCECVFLPSFPEQVEKGDIIFVGKVLDIKDDQFENFENTLAFMIDSTYTDKGGYSPQFRIVKIYKGEFPTPLENGKFHYGSQWSNCDFFFEREKIHVVFGYISQKGNITTNICTLTALANKELIHKLDNL